MSLGLPSELSARITELLHTKSRNDLATRSAGISIGYRQRSTTKELIRSSDDAIAYSLSRLPATYAATSNALFRLVEVCPEFQPKHVLDVGAGPGTASWAANSTWTNIESITMLDQSEEFLDIASRLVKGSESASLSSAKMMRHDFSNLALQEARFDLILLSYSLTEIADTTLSEVITKLWTSCDGALVIIEPGTPRDYQRIMTARRCLIGLGAHIAAPCPHADPCPLVENDWCHFTVRLPRSRDHMHMKGAVVPFEDERFSYLIATKTNIANMHPWGRILAEPTSLKFAVTFKICSTEGLYEMVVKKRNKDDFQKAKKKTWGDFI